ncbi:hypothetical protein [Alkaliphilus serpentinus]|uniref:Uncharacterized protein n=1 Tax=Alkaliphilus serpentinus TaxID=1482731 RepID=A0A833MDX4_9FIRM|nr:hypothetical protein [Alkaliphilus serpentinus]KAB3529834.1 hypothetical protein F8153_08525 [Alkaliphilus serpentinus]
MSNIKCPPPTSCPTLPGTLIKINVPAGAVINLFNIIELVSPSGICLIIRIPTQTNNATVLSTIVDGIKASGGTIEFLTQ